MQRYENNFDVLRLLAAWLVLFSHCYPLAGTGQPDPFARSIGVDTLGGVGVAIFFTLSGYLVTESWARSPTLLTFIWRRVRRIYPALIVCVAACAFVLGPLLTNLEVGAYLRHPQTRGYLETASAWWISYTLPGVFVGNPAAGVINGSLWSLPYEISCYLALLATALLPLALRFKALLVATVLLVLVLLRPENLVSTPFAKHYGLDYYHGKLGLMFAIGAVFSTWRQYFSPTWWHGALGLLLMVWLPESSLKTAAYAVSMAVTVLGLATHSKWHLALPERMGDWSYGFYLYGFPVQQLLSLQGVHQSSGFVGYVVASTFCTAIAAATSWYLVERPWLRKTSRGQSAGPERVRVRR